MMIRNTETTARAQGVPRRVIALGMARMIVRYPGLERALAISRRVWPGIKVFRNKDGTFACELDAGLSRKESHM